MRLGCRWAGESDTTNNPQKNSSTSECRGKQEGVGRKGAGWWCVGCRLGQGSCGRDAGARGGKGTTGSPVGRSRKTERGRLRDRRGMISSAVHPSVERGMGLWDGLPAASGLRVPAHES